MLGLALLAAAPPLYAQSNILQDGYEPDNSKTAAYALLSGDTLLNRNFHNVSDVDWISFTLQPGTGRAIALAPVTTQALDRWRADLYETVQGNEFHRGTFNFGRAGISLNASASFPVASDFHLRISPTTYPFYGNWSKYTVRPMAPTGGNQPPSVTITSPANNSNHTLGIPINLAATASDPENGALSVAFLINGSEVGSDTSAPFELPWQAPASGTYNLTVRATDNQNLSTTTTARTFVVSPGAQAPQITLSPPGNPPGGPFVLDQNVAMQATASDSDSANFRVEFLVDGSILCTREGSSVVNSFSCNWTASPVGTHTIMARAIDDQGLTTNSQSYVVQVNTPNLPPTITLDSPVNGASYTLNQTVPIRVTAADPENALNRVEFFSNNVIVGADTIAPFEMNYQPPSIGAYAIKARAMDNAGQGTDSVTANISVVAAANLPPTATLTAPTGNPTTITLGQSLLITATANDPEGAINRIEFLIDGATASTDAQDPYEFNWTPTSAGTFAIRARAFDAQGASGDSSSVTVIVQDNSGANPEAPPAPIADPMFPADANSARVGASRGEFRVDESGAATYALPIATVQGSGNVAPELALQYSSRNGEGVLGKGWQLSGQSSISRCGQSTESGDPIAIPVRLQSTDRFCLDGQRLKLVSGSYGAAGSTYRTEVDNLSLVTAEGSFGSGNTLAPARFKVQRKDGTTAWYGGLQQSDSARIQTSDNATIVAWPLARSQDSAGNYIDYEYQKSTGAALEYVLSNVRYTGNVRVGQSPYARVEMIYATLPINERKSSYLAGQKFQQTLRLEAIRSLGENDALIRRYALNYVSDQSGNVFSPNLGKSVLAAVQECFGTNSADCLAATQMTWNTGSGSLPAATSSTGRTLNKFKLGASGDFDGDGRQDFAALHGGQDDPARISVLLSRVDGGQDWLPDVAMACGAKVKDISGLQAIDIQGTGFDGLVYAVTDCPSGAANTGLYYQPVQATAPQIGAPVRLGDLPEGTWTDANLAVMDWNGDGLSDLVLHFSGAVQTQQGGKGWDPEAASPPVWLYQNQSTTSPSFNTALRATGGFDWLVGTPQLGSCPVNLPFREYSFYLIPDPVGPFSSDGGARPGIVASANVFLRCLAEPNSTDDKASSDIVQWPVSALEADSSQGMTRVAHAVGVYSLEQQIDGSQALTRYAEVTINAFGEDRILPIEANGDGLTDFLIVEQPGSGSCSGNLCRISLQINTGRSLLPPVPQFTVNKDLAPWVRLLDYNADGSADLLVPSAHDSSSARWRVHAWTWNDTQGSFASSPIDGPPAGKLFDVDGGAQSFFFDRNGDGRNDQLLLTRQNNDYQVNSAFGTLTGGSCVNGGNGLCPLAVVRDITDGLGAWTRLEYRSLAQRSVYTRDVEGPYLGYGNGAPVYDLIAPMFVVAQASSLSPHYQLDPQANGSDYFGQASTSTRYYYTGAKMQAGGRGFLGFREVASYDANSGVLTRTSYHQQFPYLGVPKQTESSYQPSNPWPQSDDLPARFGCVGCTNKAIESGLVLGTSVNVWSTRNTDAGLPFIYMARSEDRKYKPVLSNGAVVQTAFVSLTVTENSQIDAYGNIGQVRVQTFADEAGLGLAASDQISTNTYATPGSLWLLGRLQCTTVSSARPGETTITRISSFGYDASTGILNRETVQPASCASVSGFEQNTQYTLNDFGLRTVTTTDARLVSTSRIKRTEYDLKGRFAEAEFVTINGVERELSRVLARDVFGNALQTRAGNGVVSYSYFDAIGRPHYSYAPNGSWTRVLHHAGGGSHCPADTALFEETTASDGARTLLCKDKLGRETRKVSFGFDGSAIYVDTHYDIASRPVEVSEPYFAGQATYWARTVYDEFGRVEFARMPDGSLNTNRYDGLLTQSSNGLGQITETETNVLGEVILTRVGKGTLAEASTESHYDALGRLIWTDGPLPGTIDRIQTSYAITGQRTLLTDPDKGTWRWQVNGYGETTCQIDAKGQGQFSSYDSVGRLISRSERTGVSDPNTCAGTELGLATWTYSDAINTGAFGQVIDDSYRYTDPSVGEHRSSTHVTYDHLGRVSEKVTTIAEGQNLNNPLSFTERQTYDQFGRVFQAFDASGGSRGIRNVYGSFGHLTAIREAREGASGKVYWELQAQDARGQVKQARFGNGFNAYANYDAASGRLLSLVDSNGATLVQDLQMRWDAIGNLTFRRDSGGGRNLSERFEYDARNRLLKTFDLNGQDYTAVGTLRQEQTYDASGNILGKSDVGNYSYNTVRPHAVRTAGGTSYNYDDNGNMISDSSGRSLQYSLRDQVTRITRNGDRTEFHYGSNGQRIVRRDLLNLAVTARTYYVGNVEIYWTPAGGREFRRAIGDSVQATWKENSAVLQINYLHKDHLGSTTSITNETGQVVTNMAFDPWGRRRAASAWYPYTAPGASLTAMLAITPRGYTGHEHVDTLGIIHMNGRIYDPLLGRFLQADPLIEDAATLNRYSYVHNNPLSYTDPSGYFSLGQLVRTVAAIAITIYSGGTAAGAAWGFFGTTVSTAQAFAAVVIGGAVSGAITSGTIEGAAWGAFSAAVFFGIGQGIAEGGKWLHNVDGSLNSTGLAVKTVSHGLAGGVISKLQGGKFGNGFFSAAGSAVISPLHDLSSAKGIWVGGAVSALAGGTMSRLSGGKFANGALTAAMSYAFNQVASSRQGAAPGDARGMTYDPKDPNYHRYELDDKICAVDSVCTLENVAYASRLHPAPGTLNSTVPIVDGQIGLAQIGWTGSFDDFGPIVHSVSSDGLTIRNTTIEGHLLHPGYVERTAYEKDGWIRIRTIGEGTGRLAALNNAGSIPMWRELVNSHVRYRVSLGYGRQ